MPLVWILRRRGHSRTEKITGIEYIPTVAKAGLEDGTRHFFYGGAPGVAQEGGRKLQELVPGVLVVGTSSPPFADIDPCGFPGLAVTQLADLGVARTVETAGAEFAPILAAHLHRP